MVINLASVYVELLTGRYKYFPEFPKSFYLMPLSYIIISAINCVFMCISGCYIPE